ncbi:hypothetical protein MGYG_02261 [Nannizzia gypsea CBS 118893]|uniref:Uncharacterized protein n=1 Tax=Arthroderma gypseum (strain ATCC MYA-4604 / CBS 118893) TaxID=535722 RepID=E4UQL9_ARTGP|nr:hypothetical protein MGYG_02261 [Nannizzia gypsea CBS 118893]EFQ99248.1 hypothetical protein MGYG_02261 [Nannizzia gypsea CBS 118893]
MDDLLDGGGIGPLAMVWFCSAPGHASGKIESPSPLDLDLARHRRLLDGMFDRIGMGWTDVAVFAAVKGAPASVVADVDVKGLLTHDVEVVALRFGIP